MSSVITVENLGKKYTISHQQREEYSSLRDVITNGAKNLGKRIFSPFTLHSSPLSVSPSPLIPTSEDFWALKDVSFEVKQGDRIGIIGRNGAGKSTLLKILSRITEPTTGSVRIKGRVASLLEVGTGFHPELTGRENIFLNGAILGMQREEIRRKFDEIVAFAEVEKFLDTPVKRYSSGMYVRLAFAVAAHLEPEILIVDEVLAVGDAQFQKKCLGKMEDVGREGRTVLFVSHNMAMVKNLCQRGIVLYNGCSIADLNIDDAISNYFTTSQYKHNVSDKFNRNGIAELNVKVTDSNDSDSNNFDINQQINFISRIKVDRPIKNVAFGIGIVSLTGERIITFHTKYQYNNFINVHSEVTIKIIWDHNILCPSNYRLVAALYEGNLLLSSWDEIGQFTVVESDYFHTGRLPDTSHQGYVLCPVHFQVIS
jgi:lipopolysaccharide transport system ATP-binding protein